MSADPGPDPARPDPARPDPARSAPDPARFAPAGAGPAGADPSVPDPFATHAGPYVLGALSPDERTGYERHLRGCPHCASAVRELAGLPGLLARVSSEEAAALAGQAPGRSGAGEWGWVSGVTGAPGVTGALGAGAPEAPGVAPEAASAPTAFPGRAPHPASSSGSGRGSDPDPVPGRRSPPAAALPPLPEGMLTVLLDRVRARRRRIRALVGAGSVAAAAAVAAAVIAGWGGAADRGGAEVAGSRPAATRSAEAGMGTSEGGPSSGGSPRDGSREGGSPDGGRSEPPTPAETMHAVDGPVPVTATVRLTPTDWGTRISVTCRYTGGDRPSESRSDSPSDVPSGNRPDGSGDGRDYRGSGLSPAGLPAQTSELTAVGTRSGHSSQDPDYALVVTDRQGRSQQIATWTSHPGRDAEVEGATSLTPDRIRRVEIRTADGEPVLRLEP